MLWSIGTVSPLPARLHRQMSMIPGVQDRPAIISADAAYDAREIRQYNRKRGIKTNIPVNKRSRKQPKRGRPIRFNLELYKKRSAVERFFSWIEAFKKIVPR
ncbi:putative transposase [Methanoculleus bourgensis MS2]|uniref:Transposase n=2 Tax=Methanoculleus bourgensis TaxID=83986 RepID=I7LJC7_METBM|nr:putative transposase [Methanoculleus bourgensis MS2]